VKFHSQADPQQNYLIDFWVAPAQGQLQIQEVRIYKAPLQTDGKWSVMARQPIPWWWIPASEHPGKVAAKRGWEVMSAVEEDIVKRRSDNHGTVKLTDAKTGEQVDLDFIGTHQPVRRQQGLVRGAPRPACWGRGLGRDRREHR
jgi:hypothetical protein